MSDPSAETAPQIAARRLRAATVKFESVDPEHAAAKWALAQYFSELDTRFDGGFDPGEPTAEEVAALRPPDGRFLLIRSDEAHIGCGALQRIDGETAEVKRMWIHSEWRGLGLGRRLLTTLEATAGELGYLRIVLDTNSELVEAIRMYRAAGYESIERYNDNPYALQWFAKSL